MAKICRKKGEGYRRVCRPCTTLTKTVVWRAAAVVRICSISWGRLVVAIVVADVAGNQANIRVHNTRSATLCSGVVLVREEETSKTL